jgi:hypothetical protein
MRMSDGRKEGKEGKEGKVAFLALRSASPSGTFSGIL